MSKARALAETITQKPDLIICSKFLRTQQTTVPLIQKFPLVTVKILPVHEFTYLSPRSCSGTTNHQRTKWVADYWEHAKPGYIHGPGAESFDQFIKRVELCLDTLAIIEHRNILVFTHGHVLRAIWQTLSNTEFSDHQARFNHFHEKMGLLPVPNTCVFRANFNNNQWQIIEPQLPVNLSK